MNTRFISLILLFALPLFAAQSLEEKARLERVSAEVQRRLNLRKQAAIAEENARRVLREDDSGQKKASDDELAAARAVVRDADERHASESNSKSKSPGKDDRVALTLPDADMDTVASACRHLFGRPVTVSERARSKSVFIKFSAVPLEDARRKLIAGLREHGIYLIYRADGIFLDSMPENSSSK